MLTVLQKRSYRADHAETSLGAHVNTPFGVSWDDLDYETLRRFLEGPVNESLTWEAKGGSVRPEHIRSAICAFGNSDLGGYLVLGASQEAMNGPWLTEGIDIPTEPELWIADCLGHGGVDPLPSVLPKAWRVPGGRWVAVLQVHPVGVTPCLTSAGEVWERLSGKSQRVIDSAALRRLFERGERARKRSEEAATAAVRSMTESPPERRHHKAIVAVAPTSLGPDISGLVFRSSTILAMREALLGPLGGDATDHSLNQVSYTMWSVEPGREAGSRHIGYAIRAGREGGVAVGLADPDIASGLLSVAQRRLSVESMWSTGVALLQGMGAVGAAFVVVRLWDDSLGNVDIVRWTNVEEPSADELASVEREARRARGIAAWEA
jgi:hypothetical protein